MEELLLGAYGEILQTLIASSLMCQPNILSPGGVRARDMMMFTVGAMGEVNKNLVSIEKEIRILGTIAKIFIGIRAVGVLILIRWLLWATHIF